MARRATWTKDTRVRHGLGFLAIATSLVAGFAALAPACDNQGEGEACSILGDNAGNDECQNGLQCKFHGDLGAAAGSVDRCCPVDITQATTVVCSGAQANTNDGGPPPPLADASSDSATGDAGAHTADAPLDVPVVDSSSDGG